MILLAPDKFKGSLPASGVAEALRRGILAGRPEADVVAVPVADGGDGTLDAALAAGRKGRAAASKQSGDR